MRVVILAVNRKFDGSRLTFAHEISTGSSKFRVKYYLICDEIDASKFDWHDCAKEGKIFRAKNIRNKCLA